jgi:ribosomal protein S18 acetylase RimI-like enzyme
MTLLLRRALAHEVGPVGELTLTSYLDGPALHDANGSYAASLRDAGPRAEEAELLVAVEADRPDALLATVTVCRFGTPWAEIARPAELELRMLAVAPEQRRRGLARAMMAELRARAAAEGLVLVVSVIDDNGPAHAFYRALGFRRQPDRDWLPEPDARLQVYRDVP